MEKNPAVYILASKPNGTIYIGVTSDLIKRVYEHREGLVEGFTKRYGVKMLVYYEMHANMEAAIDREKKLKAWQQHWKKRLILKDNPDWTDLYESICQ